MNNRKFKISDVVNEDFLKFPLVLLANQQYREISLEAKFVYSLLLNRLTLSQRNGWTNKDNEVYLIYTREEAANTLNISYKKAISAFKELIKVGLLEEQRQGRGYPNLLYLLKTELDDGQAKEFSDHFEGTSLSEESIEITGYDNTADQDMSKGQSKIFRNGISAHPFLAGQELPELPSIKNDIKKTDHSKMDQSQSALSGGQADNEALERILGQCELEIFDSTTQLIFQNAIERLFYSEQLHIGNATLPQTKVRSYLNLLNGEILAGVYDTLKSNTEPIKNMTAYLMSSIFNAICENESRILFSFRGG